MPIRNVLRSDPEAGVNYPVFSVREFLNYMRESLKKQGVNGVIIDTVSDVDSGFVILKKKVFNVITNKQLIEDALDFYPLRDSEFFVTTLGIIDNVGKEASVVDVIYDYDEDVAYVGLIASAVIDKDIELYNIEFNRAGRQMVITGFDGVKAVDLVVSPVVEVRYYSFVDEIIDILGDWEDAEGILNAIARVRKISKYIHY